MRRAQAAAKAAAACALLAGCALLAACAHLAVETPQNDGLTFAERRMRLQAVPAWEMRGRLAVSTGGRGFQGSFTWQQSGDRLDVSVRGPLGASVLEVTGSPAELTVAARGERRVLESPEADLSELLGWWMPVESLPDWLLGLPDPGFEADTSFGRGTALEALDQRLWHVVFERYALRDGVLVPSRIDMSHEDLRLRLTIDTWRPADDDRLSSREPEGRSSAAQEGRFSAAPEGRFSAQPKGRFSRATDARLELMHTG